MMAYTSVSEIPLHLPGEPTLIPQPSLAHSTSPPPWLQTQQENTNLPSPPQPRSYNRRSSPRSNRNNRSRRSQANTTSHGMQLPPAESAGPMSFTCAFVPPLGTMIQGTAVSPNMSQLQALSPPITPMAPLLPFALNSTYIYGRPPVAQGAAHQLPIDVTGRTYGRPIMSARHSMLVSIECGLRLHCVLLVCFLSLCLSLCLSACPFVCLSLCSFIHLYLCSFIHLSVCLSFHLSIHLSG